MNYIIDISHEGKTVKDYLTLHLKLSSKMITKLKQYEDGILLNGSRVTVRARLKCSDLLSLALEREEKTSDNILPIDIPLDIIYEDDHYIAVNKPPNMPTHTSHDHYTDTLANAMAHLYSERCLPFVFRAVNRLDRDTSGTVVFAKDAISAHKFSQLQQSKLITKEYLALCDGHLEGNGNIEGYIRRKDGSVMLREFLKTNIDGTSQYSLTDFTSLSASDSASLLLLRLHTGRTHQIRVSLADIGHPVCGDDLYGSKEPAPRQMLHSYKMIFQHPFTGKRTLIQSPVPLDLIKFSEQKGIKHEFGR